MKRILLLIGLLLASMSARAHGQCCGDCDGDREVSIDELVGVVNLALGGCDRPTPTATPTASATPTPQNTATRTPTSPPSCRSSFTSNGTNLCVFRGRFNAGCGNSLLSAFSSDGRNLVIQIDTQLANPPMVFFTARVDSATQATLVGWSSNNLQTIRPTAGTVQLANNGQQLVIFPNNPPFMILSCNFVQYNGAFVSGTASVADEREPLRSRASTLLRRAAAWQAQPPPELAASDFLHE